MDFLRSSGHDSSRERKSWGSLGRNQFHKDAQSHMSRFADRSWARRARGSGSRKRPTLLGADLGSERERPNSPSPLAESKPILQAPEEEESKPKEWRQKIESWLQANESDQSEEAKRQARRVVTNRRSFEMDSGESLWLMTYSDFGYLVNDNAVTFVLNIS